MQPQPGGFLDQSRESFNNGASTNPLKRSRENSTSIAELMKAQMEPVGNLQQSQLRSQRHSGPVISSGLRLANADQQQNQYHQNPSTPSQPFFSPFPDNLVLRMRQDRREIEQLLQAHAAELGHKLTEKWQSLYRSLLSAGARRLREKETELANAKRRKAELEALVAKITVEAQIWKEKARTDEAAAVALQAQLQSSIMGFGQTEPHRQRLGPDRAVEDAESANIDRTPGPRCHVCRRCEANVVSFPCCHLCLCKECDKVVHACPLCLTLRNSSLEVNFG